MKRNSGPEGPGFWELDGSLFKRFSVGGSRYAEIHVDAYNVTNSVRWGNPNTGFSTAAGNTFGQITGPRPAASAAIRFGATVRVLKSCQLPAASFQLGSSLPDAGAGAEAGHRLIAGSWKLELEAESWSRPHDLHPPRARATGSDRSSCRPV